MKLYIFTPNKTALFSPELEQELASTFDVIFYTEPKPLSEYADFLADESEKIVALDPDFFNWSFTKEDIDSMKNVKAICLQTTSFSWIDAAHAKEKNIPVLNLRGFSSEAVAEFALTLALGVARKLPLVAQAEYKQDFVAHQGIELKGKTAGIIGLGRIGSNVATLTKGIGMNTIYWSQNSKNESFKYKPLDEVLKTSDILFITIAQNEDTKKLLTDDLLKTMKPSTIFVSIVHQVYNHDLIVQMVQEGKLFGYGYEEDNGNPTAQKGNIYCLPALAWATKESMEANAKLWTESMIEASKSNYLNQIN